MKNAEMEGYHLAWLQHENLINKASKAVEEYDRKTAKKLFNQYQDFFVLVFRHWLLNKTGSQVYRKFVRCLNIAFKATATENGINPHLWNLNPPKAR
ncbi:MAG: hypothetical protein GYB16_18210 [Gammaproteobacteria bacterium]|nr:hypothetical protein [Gammaproteobacteria bacterium]MEA3382634.1 hypothetical protein [Pseudomonadota bacterium]